MAKTPAGRGQADRCLKQPRSEASSSRDRSSGLSTGRALGASSVAERWASATRPWPFPGHRGTAPKRGNVDHWTLRLGRVPAQLLQIANSKVPEIAENARATGPNSRVPCVSNADCSIVFGCSIQYRAAVAVD